MYHSTIMTLLSALALSCLPSALWAALGQDCSAERSSCDPGEICVADGQGDGARFCTRRCAADAPCPEDYNCELHDGVSLCLTAPRRSALGEPCDELSCVEGLLCVEGDSGQVCAQYCELAGACPRGFSCRLGEQESGSCLESGPRASLGEPCDQRDCAEGLICVTPSGERALPYCSASCPEGVCASRMHCDEGLGRCRHLAPPPRSIGADCPLTFTDEIAAGCGGGLVCEPTQPYPNVRTDYRGQGWCTQECDRNRPCPEGYGCDHVQGRATPSPGLGVCIEGVINAPTLSPYQGSTGGSLPPFGQPDDDQSAPREPLEEEGAPEASCVSAVAPQSAAELFVTLLGVLAWRRQRR